MKEIKILKQLKERMKHLRGQHNQLDHAWNRGMGGGSQISMSDYQNIVKRLDEQVAAGEITQQLANLTRENLQKKANAYYDSKISLSLGMAPTRIQRARERLSKLRTNIDTAWNRGLGTQDIQSAAQQNILANQNTNLITTSEDNFEASIRSLMSNFPQPPKAYQEQFDIAMSNVLKEMLNKSYAISYRPEDLAHLQMLAFTKVLDQYRPTNNPNADKYDIIPKKLQSLSRDEYDYVVNALLHGTIQSQLNTKTPKTIATATPISPDAKRPYDLTVNKPKIENTQVADKIIEAFNEVIKKDSNVFFDLNKKSNAVAAFVQSLSRENQLYLIENSDAQKQLLDNELLSEVQIAIAAFGHPDARLKIAEFAYNQPDRSLYDIISELNLEAAIASGSSDEDLKQMITELIRYGNENLTGSHLQQALSYVGPNKDIPESQRRHFFAEGIIPPEPHPRIVKIANEIYENTQKRFRESGITEVRLFRGGPLQGGLPYEPWSTDTKTAENFYNGSRDISELRTAIVPVKYIFSNYVYSQFFASEYEFPVLAQSFYADSNADVQIMQARTTGSVTSDQIKPQAVEAIRYHLSKIPYNKENLQYLMQYDKRYDPKSNGYQTFVPPSTFDFMNNVFKDMALQMKLNDDASKTNIAQEQVIRQKINELTKEQDSNPIDDRQFTIDYLTNFVNNTQTTYPPLVQYPSGNFIATPEPTKPKLDWDALNVGQKLFMIEGDDYDAVLGQSGSLTDSQDALFNEILDKAQENLKIRVQNNPEKSLQYLRAATLGTLLDQVKLANEVDKKNNLTSKQEQDDMDLIIKLLENMYATEFSYIP